MQKKKKKIVFCWRNNLIIIKVMIFAFYFFLLYDLIYLLHDNLQENRVFLKKFLECKIDV